MDAEKRHSELRTILQDQIDDLHAESQSLLPRRWYVQCYHSLDKFIEMFPSAVDQSRIIDKLRDDRDSVRLAVATALERAVRLVNQKH